MKKLRLDVEALEVDSFDATAERARRGTVEAHGIPYTDEAIGTCGCGGTRWCTAAMTCAYTCFIQETCEPGVCF